MTRQTANELIPAVGHTVLVRMECIGVLCKVIDAKNVYGKVRLLVRPQAGAGEQWIELSRLMRGEIPSQEIAR